MQAILEQVVNECKKYIAEGKVANYIPELAKADVNQFGIYAVDYDQKEYFAGDYDVPFTMQSVIKPVILLTALSDVGIERVRELVGVEATGKPFDAFNYSDQALKGEHINPMINTGAIALCTLIKGETYQEKFDRLLRLTKKLTGNAALKIDESVYLSEKATGNKNRALAYMLKAYGLIDGNVDEIVDCYFRACSVQATCKDLAKMAFVLANHGVDPATGERIVSAQHARYANAILSICGTYDGSGEFALNVGIPAKSGVSGGIMAIAPKRMGLGVFSPALDKKGNSMAGKKALELLSERLDLSVF